MQRRFQLDSCRLCLFQHASGRVQTLQHSLRVMLFICSVTCHWNLVKQHTGLLNGLPFAICHLNDQNIELVLKAALLLGVVLRNCCCLNVKRRQQLQDDGHRICLSPSSSSSPQPGMRDAPKWAQQSKHSLLWRISNVSVSLCDIMCPLVAFISCKNLI